MYGIIVILSTAYLLFVSGIEIERCNDNDLYLFDGQAVQITQQFFMTYMSGCRYENVSVETNVENNKVEVFRFDSVSKLKQPVDHLSVSNIIWPSSPETPLEQLHLRNVTVRPGKWDGCSRLKFLFITGGNLTMVTRDWLTNCSKLFLLDISNLSVQQIRVIFDSAVYADMIVLRTIKDIGHIVKYPLFTESFQSFKEIHLIFDEVQDSSLEVSYTFIWQLSLLPNLQRLYIQQWNRFDMCSRSNFSSITFGSLETLYLDATNTTRFCFRQHIIIPQLKKLTFSAAQASSIQFGELFSTPHNLTVGVYSSQNVYLNFTRADYLALTNVSYKVNVTLTQGLLLDCNKSCSGDAFWLARSMRMGLVNVRRPFCPNRAQYVDSSCERIECERVSCEGGCVCCRVAGDAVVADCRDANLTALPAALLRLDNLTELLAPNNNIASLPDTLPDTLIRIDLSGNRIRMSASEASTLFAVRARRVRLAGNPLVCTCDNQPLLNASYNKYLQIKDMEKIFCSGDNEKFIEFSKACELRALNITLMKEKENKKSEKELANNREAALITTVAVTTALAIVALILGVALYYRRTIQIILFARGWCMCWLRDDDSDEDRRYDVFLSFCHEDAELVLDQILPTLDQNYSVCIHLRDWIPGDMIPANIRRSVEESRRTLVILSKNFAKSLWGLMEFQTAYASGIDEKRIRVVMVVLDDVLEWPELNKDFREYVRIVRFNTYVRWDDPWFWSKLRYALPHQTRVSLQENQPARYSVPALIEGGSVQSSEPRSPDEAQPELRSAPFTVPITPARGVPRSLNVLSSQYISPDEPSLKLHTV